MPLNSLIPVLAMPWTFLLVVSTSQKSLRSELPPRGDVGRGVGADCARAFEAADPAAAAATAREEFFRNARRLEFPADSSGFWAITRPPTGELFPRPLYSIGLVDGEIQVELTD